jgi:thioredoxin-dependent peroxiredoxin
MKNIFLSKELGKMIFGLGLISLYSLWIFSVPAWSKPASIDRGQTLPNATLLNGNNSPTQLGTLKGRVKILSMVPQLNTPVCDEQTHRFSEKNEGLDQQLEIVTISTNTNDDQALFAEKAGIANVTFLSDSPQFDFGKKTGLLHPMHQILQRSVMVVDEENIVRYIEIVPMSQLPNFPAAFDAARRVLGQ